MPEDGDAEPEKGFFGIELVGMTRCEQGYLDNTAILSSVLSDDQGNAIEILDFAPRFVRYERFFRPPQLVRLAWRSATLTHCSTAWRGLP